MLVDSLNIWTVLKCSKLKLQYVVFNIILLESRSLCQVGVLKD